MDGLQSYDLAVVRAEGEWSRRISTEGEAHPPSVQDGIVEPMDDDATEPRDAVQLHVSLPPLGPLAWSEEDL